MLAASLIAINSDKMLNLYFIILFVCGIIVPILLHGLLKRKIKSSTAVLTIEIIVGLTIIFVGLIVPLYTFFSFQPDYPKVTKKIDDKYYFTQQEYGWAPSMPGKHLEFFESNTFGVDKKIGHIQWLIGTGNINAKLENVTVKNCKRIILKENNRLVFDTILPFDNYFDFKYLTWR
jgi:hypothetical protein